MMNSSVESTKMYVSGPITGNSTCEKDFEDATKILSSEGYDVVNPMLICPPEKLKFDHQREQAENRGNWNYYMREAIKKLVICDEIYMLRGWASSKGAVLERHIAQELNMPVRYQEAEELKKLNG